MVPDTLVEILASSVATLVLYALARLGQYARAKTDDARAARLTEALETAALHAVRATEQRFVSEFRGAKLSGEVADKALALAYDAARRELELHGYSAAQVGREALEDAIEAALARLK